MTVKVEKSRKGWTVRVFNKDGNILLSSATFTNRTEAYAYAYALEHGL